MNGNSNNRKEHKTSSNYPPPPVKKLFLTFLFAAALAVALVACSGESETGDNMLNAPGVDNSGDKTPGDPGGNNTGDCTIYYQLGNGAGSPWSVGANKNDTINLPGATKLTAPKTGMEFVGWNDGMLTYKADYKYTVTKDVTFNARWAFTTLTDIKAYLAGAHGDSVLIAVADGGDTTLTWESLLSAIDAAGKADTSIELDLSESTLALFDEGGGNKKFDYKDGNEDAYNSGEKYIKKLVLPSAATSMTSFSNFGSADFLSPSNLEAVSGLNVSEIPHQAFCNLGSNYTAPLAAVAFPAATSIGNSAFEHTSLTSVSLPAAISISNGAFSICPSLTSVSLPAAISIGEYAFQYCYNLTEVSLPKATSIPKQAFDNCPLTTITVGKGCDIDGGSGIHDNFKAYYDGDTSEHTAKKAAGVYTYNGTSWNYKALK
jgi:hypothetical protein